MIFASSGRSNIASTISKGDPAKTAKLNMKNQFAGNDLSADFSNYGKKGVDVFAPGSEIYNSVPQSDYAAIAGTSMACPMVAGCCCFLESLTSLKCQ